MKDNMIHFGGSNPKPKAVIYEETLSHQPDSRDILQVLEGDIIKITTLDNKLREVGSIQLNLGREVEEEDRDIIKGFYSQGIANMRRHFATLSREIISLTKSIVVTGPGSGPKL